MSDREKWRRYQQERAARRSRLTARELVTMDCLWNAFEGPHDLVGVVASAKATLGSDDTAEAPLDLARSVVADLLDHGLVEVSRGVLPPGEMLGPEEAAEALEDDQAWEWQGPNASRLILSSTDRGMDRYRELEERVWGPDA